MGKNIDLDDIFVEIGVLGRYQIRTYVLILISIVFSAFYINQYIFAAANLAYRCEVPECETNPPTFETNSWGSWALPDGTGHCKRYLPVGTTCAPGSFHPTDTRPCTNRIYENNNTIVAAFDLACEDWKRTLVGSIHSAGMFVALPFTAYVSDNFGRRIAFITTAVAPAIVGVGRSFSQNYNTYIILEFLDALVGTGVYTSGYLLALEMMGLKRRVFSGNMISCTYAIGQALLALVAWVIPEWRSFTRAIYAPSILFIFYIFFIDESVRWLLSKGNREEAARILFKAAAINKKTLSPETIKQLTEDSNLTEDSPKGSKERKTKKKPSVALQVLKSKTLMVRLSISAFWWISVTFIYYGLSINSISLAGNRYVNFILTSLVEIPGYCCSVLTLDRFGRKRSIMSAYFVCGISLACLPFIPRNLFWLQTCFNLLGKLCISMVFSSLYIYSSELYPTTLRHSLVAACSMSGRIGQTVAPLTPLLMVYMKSLPYLIFSVMAVTSGLLMLLTPETLRMKLPDTVKQAEDLRARSAESVESN